MGKNTQKKQKQKQSEIKIGNKNRNWKGGIASEEYCLEFKTTEWRQIIYERDKKKLCWNPQCEDEGTKECLHHINYDKKDCRPLNIIKICNSCNSQANFNREWWEAFYNEIMRRRYL